MRRKIIILFCLIAHCCGAQSYIELSYDFCGNRIQRHFVPLRVTNLSDSLSYHSIVSPVHGIDVFPNPTAHELNISIGEMEEGNLAILILSDIQGKILVKRETSIEQNSIDLNTFRNGTYFLKIIIKEEKFTYKITKVD